MLRVSALKKRFSVNPVLAQRQLHMMHYTFADVVKGKSPQAFAEEVIQHARNARLTDPFYQLLSIWNALDPSLQRDIRQPQPDTTKTEFMMELEEKQYLWQNLPSQARPTGH